MFDCLLFGYFVSLWLFCLCVFCVLVFGFMLMAVVVRVLIVFGLFWLFLGLWILWFDSISATVLLGVSLFGFLVSDCTCLVVGCLFCGLRRCFAGIICVGLRC